MSGTKFSGLKDRLSGNSELKHKDDKKTVYKITKTYSIDSDLVDAMTEDRVNKSALINNLLRIHYGL